MFKVEEMFRGTWVLLLGLAGTPGCLDIDSPVTSCEFNTPLIGAPDNEPAAPIVKELPPNPGGLPGKSPCIADGECAYDTCVPADNGAGKASFCFDRQQDGCNIVTWWAFNDECPPNADERVYVCGDAWDVSLLGTCKIVGTGLLGETYRCCSGAVWP